MAVISATQDTSNLNGTIVWSNVTNADTAAEALFFGGVATVEVVGTFDAATVNLQYGSVSGTTNNIDTDEKPDGTKFTSAGVTLLTISRGYLKPTFSGGGGTQSITVRVIPLSKKL